MRIAFYVYPVAFQSPGGGEIVLLKKKEYLEKAGVEVKLFDTWTDKLASFDLLHTFGSVKDSLRMMQTAKAFGVKNVLETICWYSWKSAWGTYPEWRKRVPSLTRQLAKSAFPFLPSQRKSMMQCSDLLFPNSESEAGQLVRYFQVPREKIFVVPNGVDEKFAAASPDAFHDRYAIRDFILLVGRIEPRKNQLNVLRALKGIKQPVVVIGDFVPGYKDYYEACVREAGKNVHFLGGLPHGSILLESAYAACHTFVLATWLETPGLAALEAGLAGANVVITQEGATREYFEEHAIYVRPDRLDSIREGVLKSASAPRSDSLKRRIASNYLWPQVAARTLEGYKRLLKS